jgi:hypothetical protein
MGGKKFLITYKAQPGPYGRVYGVPWKGWLQPRLSWLGIMGNQKKVCIQMQMIICINKRMGAIEDGNFNEHLAYYMYGEV